MGRNRKGWYERENKKRVTLDSIKTECKLTKREFELLQLVYDRKMVRRDLLEVISMSYRKAGDNKTRLLNRAINKLYKNMIFDKFHEVQELGKGNSPAIVSLDKGGSILLNLPHKPRIIQKKTLFDGKEIINRSLPSNHRHIHGVNKMEASTILFCERNNFQLIDWVIEEAKTFYFNDEKIVLIPDVLMILKIKGKPFVAFLEFDTGSEGLRMKEPVIIRDKIIKYKRYKASGLWMQEGFQKQFPQPIFPTLLFVTEDDKRIDFFNSKSKENKVNGLAVYHTNYSNVLEKIATLIN